jgi:hypothetical protein
MPDNFKPMYVSKYQAPITQWQGATSWTDGQTDLNYTTAKIEKLAGSLLYWTDHHSVKKERHNKLVSVHWLTKKLRVQLYVLTTYDYRYLTGKFHHNDDRNIKRIFTDKYREPLSDMMHIPQKWDVWWSHLNLILRRFNGDTVTSRRSKQMQASNKIINIL